MDDKTAAVLKAFHEAQVLHFEEDYTFGQGNFGKRCRICLRDDYVTASGAINHEPWCEGIRDQIVAFVTGE